MFHSLALPYRVYVLWTQFLYCLSLGFSNNPKAGRRAGLCCSLSSSAPSSLPLISETEVHRTIPPVSCASFSRRCHTGLEWDGLQQKTALLPAVGLSEDPHTEGECACNSCSWSGCAQDTQDSCIWQQHTQLRTT